MLEMKKYFYFLVREIARGGSQLIIKTYTYRSTHTPQTYRQMILLRQSHHAGELLQGLLKTAKWRGGKSNQSHIQNHQTYRHIDNRQNNSPTHLYSSYAGDEKYLLLKIFAEDRNSANDAGEHAGDAVARCDVANEGYSAANERYGNAGTAFYSTMSGDGAPAKIESDYKVGGGHKEDHAGEDAGEIYQNAGTTHYPIEMLAGMSKDMKMLAQFLTVLMMLVVMSIVLCAMVMLVI